MRYAVIAAGEGSRLSNEGIMVPKPLVEVGGEQLIDRLIRIFMDNDADEIVVICNDATTLVASHLLHIQRDGLNGHPVPLHFYVKSTQSSMHSFYEIGSDLKDSPFVLTTVDTVFDETEFATYVDTFRSSGEDGVMGVTGYIDDEKPLYVGTDDDMYINGYYDDTADNECKYISAGIYGLKPKAIKTLERCVECGESRMRNFQRALVSDGFKLRAYEFSKVLDIDHAEDIRKAEAFFGK